MVSPSKKVRMDAVTSSDGEDGQKPTEPIVDCLKCKYSDLKSKHIPVPPEKKTTGSDIPVTSPEVDGKTPNGIKELPVATRLALTKMGIAVYPRVQQVPITHRQADSTTTDFMHYYIAFINSIDLSRTCELIKKYDLNVFCSILCGSYTDPLIADFIIQLGTYSFPQACKKKDLSLIFCIYIFAYIHVKRHGGNLKPHKKYIIENSFIFAPTQLCEISWQGDSFIDKYIVLLRRHTADLKEALFLNQMYLERQPGKSFIDAFVCRLHSAIEIVPDHNIFSFFQHVFTYKTVMFSCINEMQLYQLVISYYKNHCKAEHLATLLAILVDRIDDMEIHEFLIKEFFGLQLSTLKYKKQSQLVAIRNFKLLDEYVEFFAQHADSYCAMERCLLELGNLYSGAKSCQVSAPFMDILAVFFKTLKPIFLPRLLKSLNILIMDVIGGLASDDVGFVACNKAHWGTLADIILATQRLGAEHQASKKKKVSGAVKVSELSKQACALVDLITTLEEQVPGESKASIVRLKHRGFKIL